MDKTPTSPDALPGVVAVLLVDHLPRHRAWAWLQLARGAAGLSSAPGLQFAKVMGSGQDGGFGLRPSATHQGLVTVFDTLEHAQAFIDGPIVAGYRDRASQWWCGLMAITSSRGSWDGFEWANTPQAQYDDKAHGQGLAVITRASIRPAKVAAFWRRSPPAQKALGRAEGCELAMGLGEAPLLRQCTFSLWRDEPSMLAYARGGAHGQAAQAAWRDDFFSESMFVRMRILATQGQWQPPPASVFVMESAHG